MKKYILGNWKMNMLPNETLKYIECLDDKLKEYNKINEISDLKEKVDIKIYIPYINIFYANLMAQETDIIIGAQNMCCQDKGAFTGEISAQMLKSVDIYSVLIGHSERRKIFNESNMMINKKLIKSQEENMQAIFCIGETLEENESGKTEEILREQIREGLKDVDIKDIIIAYEPVWAIGTGIICDSNTANSISKMIKDIVKEKYNKEILVVYGGSVNDENSKEILNKEYIDGVLVGGASLDVNKFFSIIISGIES